MCAGIRREFNTTSSSVKALMGVVSGSVVSVRGVVVSAVTVPHHVVIMRTMMVILMVPKVLGRSVVETCKDI